MSLLEKKIIDRIEIIENGCIQIREASIIEKDGVEIHRSFHRYVLHPGQDLNDQDPKVVAVASVIWTEDVIQSFLESTNIEQQ